MDGLIDLAEMTDIIRLQLLRVQDSLLSHSWWVVTLPLPKYLPWRQGWYIHLSWSKFPFSETHPLPFTTPHLESHRNGLSSHDYHAMWSQCLGSGWLSWVDSWHRTVLQLDAKNTYTKGYEEAVEHSALKGLRESSVASDFPDGPVAKTPCSQSRGAKFNP